MIGKESGQYDLAAWGIKHKPGILDRIDEELDWRRFSEDIAQGVQGLQGRSPLLSARDAVQGAAAPAMVRLERSHGGGSD